MLTLMAWAFTCLSGLGVWRYLKNVDKVFSPRFLFLSPYKPLGLKSKNYLFT